MKISEKCIILTVSCIVLGYYKEKKQQQPQPHNKKQRTDHKRRETLTYAEVKATEATSIVPMSF